MRRRTGAARRWTTVVGLVGALVGLPTLVGALPVAVPAQASALTAGQLLARVRASDGVGWSGYGESRGSLVLPDVRELAELPGLLGGRTRARAWWRGPQDWRVDALSLVGETDTTRDADGGWTWDSADRRALRIVGDLDVRLPTAADLLAPTLGHRLAGTAQVTASLLPGRRVAGRSTVGLRLVPQQPAETTVTAVELWAEPATGLPLAVEVHARGVTEPVVSAVLLDLDLRPPPPQRTLFTRPVGATVTVGEAPDVAALVDRFAPYTLPDALARLPRRDRSPLAAGGGVGTYGDGFTALALLPLPRDLAQRIVDRVDNADDDGVARISTPLVNALVAVTGRRRAYLLVGTVPASRLTEALVQLRADPPPRTDR